MTACSQKLRQAAPRPRRATGAFILNAGLGKLNADDDTAKALHGMAAAPTRSSARCRRSRS